MALDSLIRKGVALANKFTSSIQCTVSHKPWTAALSDGDTYGTAVPLQALVEYESRLIRDAKGNERESKAKVTIIGPITANGAAGRTEPIDSRDLFVLPDGTQGVILDVQGVADRSTGKPYMYEVRLGIGF